MDKLIIYDTPQTKNPCYQRGRSMRPFNILVHSTGANNPWLKRYVDAPGVLGINKNGNHWNKASATKCMHAFIGKDINGDVAVAVTLPYTTASWGCGKGVKGSYNRDPVGHIQFEICEDGLNDESYYRKAFEVAEKYCAMLCQRFGFDPMGITSHYEAAALGYASNHADPRHWMRKFGDSMDAFRQRVAARVAGAPIEPVEQTRKEVVRGMETVRRGDRGDTVKVLQDALNILGYKAGTVDGIFGKNTFSALKAFQKDHNLKVDGIAGGNTWDALDTVMSAIVEPPEEELPPSTQDESAEPTKETVTIMLSQDVAQALLEALKGVVR
ncbi:MAG: peptidoglycan-binding protein [Christensenellales bacterium]